MKKCGATSPAEIGKSGRGQDITLTCDKVGRHLIHKDDKVKASFIKVGKGGPVWPSK